MHYSSFNNLDQEGTVTKRHSALKAIAAMSLNRVIGKGNALPWDIPEELQWFKQKTLDQIIFMGRKTFDSIGRPLPRRQSVVLSRSVNPIEGVTVIHKLSDLLSLQSDKTIWVIGGAEIYRLTLPYISDLYLTKVKMTVSEGDAFFPPFEDIFNEFEIIEDNAIYKIIHYKNPSPLIIDP